MPPSTRPLLHRWWVPVARGLLAIAFGILTAVISPITQVVLLMLFAAFALLDGIISLGAAIGSRDWGWQLLGGLLSVAIGLVTVLRPINAGLAVVVLVAAWAITRGLVDMVSAVRLQGESSSRPEGPVILSGVISILFGFLVAAWPLIGAFPIADLIAAFASALGITLAATGLRERSLRRTQLGSAPDNVMLR